jgi:sulfonate transport system ATP-binding protein
MQIWSTHRTTVILVTQDVEEAIYLGDTIVVMLPNPGRIQRQVAVDLAEPRDRTSHAFTAQRHQILAEMGAAPTPRKDSRMRLVR